MAQKPLQEKLRVSERIIETLTHVDTPLKQDLLVQKASQVLGIPVDSIKREIARSLKSSYVAKDQEKIEQTKVPSMASPRMSTEPSKLEKRIFFAIINNIQLVNGAREDYLIRYFSESLRMLLMKVKQEKDANPG